MLCAGRDSEGSQDYKFIQSLIDSQQGGRVCVDHLSLVQTEEESWYSIIM